MLHSVMTVSLTKKKNNNKKVTKRRAFLSLDKNDAVNAYADLAKSLSVANGNDLTLNNMSTVLLYSNFRKFKTVGATKKHRNCHITPQLHLPTPITHTYIMNPFNFS